jgi:hypothetical protein
MLKHSFSMRLFSYPSTVDTDYSNIEYLLVVLTTNNSSKWFSHSFLTFLKFSFYKDIYNNMYPKIKASLLMTKTTILNSINFLNFNLFCEYTQVPS